MKIHSNKTAGLITIDDLSESEQIIVMNQKGGIVQRLFTITPSITLDIDKWLDGWYDVITMNNKKKEVLHFLVTH